ncbi:MAG TPA: hypothetical protein VFF82_10625 [Rhodocyclaceae bacterium]|nr:hypothetical protein [Rhodocyclaceae bacterium]
MKRLIALLLVAILGGCVVFPLDGGWDHDGRHDHHWHGDRHEWHER